jgi:hypothetical protein
MFGESENDAKDISGVEERLGVGVEVADGVEAFGTRPLVQPTDSNSAMTIIF